MCATWVALTSLHGPYLNYSVPLPVNGRGTLTDGLSIANRMLDRYNLPLYFFMLNGERLISFEYHTDLVAQRGLLSKGYTKLSYIIFSFNFRYNFYLISIED